MHVAPRLIGRLDLQAITYKIATSYIAEVVNSHEAETVCTAIALVLCDYAFGVRAGAGASKVAGCPTKDGDAVRAPSPAKDQFGFCSASESGLWQISLQFSVRREKRRRHTQDSQRLGTGVWRSQLERRHGLVQCRNGSRRFQSHQRSWSA